TPVGGARARRELPDTTRSTLLPPGSTSPEPRSTAHRSNDYCGGLYEDRDGSSADTRVLRESPWCHIRRHFAARPLRRRIAETRWLRLLAACSGTRRRHSATSSHTGCTRRPSPWAQTAPHSAPLARR